jgi:hypothetical protein
LNVMQMLQLRIDVRSRVNDRAHVVELAQSLSPWWSVSLEELVITQLVMTYLLLWYLNIHYPVHRSPPLYSIPTHLNSVHNMEPYFSNTHFNVRLLYRARFEKRPLPLRFSSRMSVYFSYPCVLPVVGPYFQSTRLILDREYKFRILSSCNLHPSSTTSFLGADILLRRSQSLLGRPHTNCIKTSIKT